MIIRPKIKKLFSKIQQELKHSIDDFAGNRYNYEEFKNGLRQIAKDRTAARNDFILKNLPNV